MNKQTAKPAAPKKKLAPKAPPVPMTPEEIEKAKKAAEEKAEKLRQQVASDQTLLDSYTANLSPEQKDVIFKDISRKCKDTTMKNGKVVLACPLPTKLSNNCVSADKFTCVNGKVGLGCALSPDVMKSLNKGNVRIDGSLVSRAEGGSYLSPYVPWAVFRGSNKKGPAISPGNSSGVTVGTGVDLGKVNPKTYLQDLEKRGVSKETRDKLQPFLGLTREDACKALRDAKDKGGPIVFPQKDIDLIDLDAFERRVPGLRSSFDNQNKQRLAQFQKDIDLESKKKIPDQNKIKSLQDKVNGARDFDHLSTAQQTVLMSTYYHQGNITTKPINEVAAAFSDNDLAAAEKALGTKMRSSNKVIADRAKRELEYLKSEVPKTIQ
jgi:lysozyme-like predicted toxin